MSRYIDADAFCKEIVKIQDLRRLSTATIGDALHRIPTADVVEVVRCKDCKWYEIDELRKDGEVDRRYKPSVCYLYQQYQEETYFCADGERREDDN